MNLSVFNRLLIGCSMFTAQLVIESPHRASLLQHLIALAAVHGIRTMTGYQDLVRKLSSLDHYQIEKKDVFLPR